MHWLIISVKDLYVFHWICIHSALFLRIHLPQMNVLFVLHLQWFYSREQEMSLWLDVLEGFSALFIDPLKLLSLIVKFSFHSSALTLWIFPCLLAIFYLTFSLLRLYLFICLNSQWWCVWFVFMHLQYDKYDKALLVKEP